MIIVSKMNFNKPLTIENLNPRILNQEFGVRGTVVSRAMEIEKEMKLNPDKFPFNAIIHTSIGDGFAYAKKRPITYIRQFIAGCSYPEMMDTPGFPSDVKQRVQRLLTACAGENLGSYSESPGIFVIREDIASYIQRRDGYPSDPQNIYLSAGACDGIRTVIKLLMNDDTQMPSGIMVPVPQFPFYTAIVTEYGGHQIEYFLDEENNWAINIDELERVINESKDCCTPRGIVIINPGNPTGTFVISHSFDSLKLSTILVEGQILSYENIRDIIHFAHRHHLFILADEVYQENVYDSHSKFVSFKKVLMDLGSSYDRVQLASFHSTSKGWHYEAGSRGGYFEIIHLDEDVRYQLCKTVSVNLCSTTWGQAIMDAIVNPPKVGEPSYELYQSERDDTLHHLKQNAEIISELFNSIEGIQCNRVMGALYAFPRIEMPEKAIKHARSTNIEPDTFYCLELLEKTGICTVPGSSFKQKSGTYHFRVTILPPMDEMKDTIGKFRTFHLSFLKRWK